MGYLSCELIRQIGFSAKFLRQLLQVSTLVDVCAYAGTGNVLKIQKLLHMCSEHYETEDKKKKVKNWRLL